jgi:DNA-directed RNA polymerase specialized sigma24 family protein
MSVALPFPDKEDPQPSNRIWLKDVDGDGRTVDPRFIEAGYRKENEFFRYRSDKLRDKAIIANLIEEAVYRASRANNQKPLRDVGGYLFKVFSRLADREIARSPRAFSCETGSLDNLRGCPPEPHHHVLNRIHVREILDAIEPDLRWAVERRILGYEVQEIASEIQISADCLSTRMRRGLKCALKRLLGEDCL